MANCNTNSIIWGERATSIKYVNSITVGSNWFWTKFKENMEIFRHVNSSVASYTSYIFIYRSSLYLPHKYLSFYCPKITFSMLIWLVKSTTVVFIRSPATQSVVFIPVASGLHHREIPMTNFSINIQRTRPWLWYRTFGVINWVCANSNDLNMATSHINQWGESRYFYRSPSRMKTTAVVFISLPGVLMCGKPPHCWSSRNWKPQ